MKNHIVPMTEKLRPAPYKIWLPCFFLIWALAVRAELAHATISLDYSLDSSNPLASVYYNPAIDSYLHGSSIAVTTVTGITTPQNSGPAGALPITPGSLNFISGSFTGMSNNGTTWNFSGGGSIAITGQTSLDSSSTTLLQGTFNSISVTQLFQTGQLEFNLIGASLNGTENQKIYSYFGIPVNSASSDGFNLSFIATPNASSNGFTSTSIASGNIVDIPTPTPIPAAAWLFGSGLLGFAGFRKRADG